MIGEEIMLKFKECICERCDCADECEYYEETIKPILDVIAPFSIGDSFLVAISNVIKDFECEYFEEKVR